MKKALLVISIILFIGVALLIAVNWNNYQPVHYFFSSEKIAGELSYLYKTVNISLYTATVLFAGIVIGICAIYPLYLNSKDRVKAYERELEKSSVAGQDSASKVNVLDAKIKTLETAFNTMVEEKNKLEKELQSYKSEE